MDAIKQILKKGEELLTGRRKKRMIKEILVNAEALETRVAVLEDGRLVQLGSVQEVCARPATPAVARLILR